MKLLLKTMSLICFASVAAYADDVVQPVPASVQQVAPQGNLAPAYLFMPTKPADTVVPFFDIAKCDAAVKAVAPAYKAACVHTN